MPSVFHDSLSSLLQLTERSNQIQSSKKQPWSEHSLTKCLIIHRYWPQIQCQQPFWTQAGADSDWDRKAIWSGKKDDGKLETATQKRRAVDSDRWKVLGQSWQFCGISCAEGRGWSENGIFEMRERLQGFGVKKGCHSVIELMNGSKVQKWNVSTTHIVDGGIPDYWWSRSDFVLLGPSFVSQLYWFTIITHDMSRLLFSYNRQVHLHHSSCWALRRYTS